MGISMQAVFISSSLSIEAVMFSMSLPMLS
jgi:hypothetical protein